MQDEPTTNLTCRRRRILAVSLLVLATGCGKKKPPQPPQAASPPVSATLSANPDSIQNGQSSTLNWSTQNATEVILEGKKVDANGSQTVTLTQTTTYHLTAKGAGGTRDASVRVTVAAPPPGPPPPPSSPDDGGPGPMLVAVTDIYFDYDNASLRSEAVQALARTPDIIKAHPNWTVQIQGNCDERGSTEYNLALGERRAGAAQQALIRQGVSVAQLRTISFGNEKPVCTESTEDCWQKNRRDHFVLMH